MQDKQGAHGDTQRTPPRGQGRVQEVRMADPLVVVSVGEGVGRLRLNRPQKRNALNSDLAALFASVDRLHGLVNVSLFSPYSW